jgi:hypothetical protein
MSDVQGSVRSACRLSRCESLWFPLGPVEVCSKVLLANSFRRDLVSSGFSLS